MPTNATISVNKETVRLYLESGKTNPFLIPEYQRPYAWGEDEASKLFEDLHDFARSEVEREKQGVKKEGTYFLGSIVSFLNENDEREVIDGQQRLTSLMLLLRAIYTKLERTDPMTEQAENFIRQIQPCLWIKDKYTGKVDTTKMLIRSNAMDDNFNARLQLILDTGETDEEWTDNYSENYRLFQRLFDKLSADNAFFVYAFIHNLLNNAIVLPIQADTQDTALTIFSTLNDRVLPLSDADIFKAKMYDSLQGDERDDLMRSWRELEARSLDVDETMQHLFYVYMFYDRAVKGDDKTTTPGARKYFSQDKFSSLKQPGVLDKLADILDLLTIAKVRKPVSGIPWSEDVTILQALDMLACYPNDWWQYAVSTYYLLHKDDDSFDEAFPAFLNKLFAELLRVYVLFPTVNSIKGGIMKLNVASVESAVPRFDFRQADVNDPQWREGVVHPRNRYTRRMVIAATSYTEPSQDGLLPEGWEVEHVFPQHWSANYDCEGHTSEKLAEIVEEIGNLIALEKPLNIGASDGYYDKKRVEYAKSSIGVARTMAKRLGWHVDDIHERNVRVVDQLRDAFEIWSDTYNSLMEIGA